MNENSRTVSASVSNWPLYRRQQRRGSRSLGLGRGDVGTGERRWLLPSPDRHVRRDGEVCLSVQDQLERLPDSGVLRESWSAGIQDRHSIECDLRLPETGA